jgi:hypothetical protein
VRGLQLHLKFNLRRSWTTGSTHRYLSVVGLTESFMKVKLHGWEEEIFDDRCGHRGSTFHEF